MVYINEISLITINKVGTNIENGVFKDCSKLNSVAIPDCVISIVGCAFCNCEKLTSIKIFYNVKSNKDKACSGCSNLTSLGIGNHWG